MKKHLYRVKLYCKGADTVILKRLAKDQGGIAEVSVKHLEEFAHAGYRTLCIAEREVLLGVTAVEDKLQDGVQETVTVLAQAGIKLWVLTGDKLETAVAIGLSCNLLADSMHLFLMYESSHSSVAQMLHNMLDEARQRTRSRRSAGIDASDMAMVIEGSSLAVALEENNRINFLELCQQCRTVVCCRVTPLQKAQVTHLVKENALAVTLAIGDGANDVGMIKAAHIGVGISGREGMAAVLASDYAIAQFRFLARLLLVHGRWSYKRNKDLVMYAFYKNIVYVMGNCYLAFFSGLSAQALYPSALISTFNLFWTSLPTMAFAVLDKDVHQSTAENNPQLYSETRGEKMQVFFQGVNGWLLSAIWHSIVAFFFPAISIIVAGVDGTTNGLSVLGVSAYSLAVVIVNVKIMTRMNIFTWISNFVVWGVSVFLWFVFLLLLSFLWEITHFFPDLCGVGVKLYTSTNFWLTLCLGLAAAILPDCAVSVFYRKLAPADYQIIQEMEHGWRSGFYSKRTSFVEQLSNSEKQTDTVTKQSQGPSRRQGSLDSADTTSGRMSPSGLVLELVQFPSKKVTPSHMENDGMPPSRRMTWREVLSEVEVEDFDHMDSAPGWGSRRSSGFEVVTSHNDSSTIPKPLTEGPLPTCQTPAEES